MSTEPNSFDAIAADYAVLRSVHPKLLRRLIEVPGIKPSWRVLEVGCGTGNYVASISAATSARCSGLDPSRRMLSAARQKTTPVSWSQGRAESLPYPDGSFEFTFSVDVIHHVQDRQAFFREAFRVLADGGWIATGTDSEETIRQRMPLSYYFPETVAPELRRYPKRGEIPQFLASVGFGQISEELAEFAYGLSDATAIERKTFTSLHLISEEAFGQGLHRLKRDLEAGPISCVSRNMIYWARKLEATQRGR
ncbi:MAG: methyltransferase domain-containing protein [Verrucomicrobia bacterium]|nr:methyltransferase domain-containing protein [Verrucomicrobiota bacterium]